MTTACLWAVNCQFRHLCFTKLSTSVKQHSIRCLMLILKVRPDWALVLYSLRVGSKLQYFSPIYFPLFLSKKRKRRGKYEDSLSPSLVCSIFHWSPLFLLRPEYDLSLSRPGRWVCEEQAGAAAALNKFWPAAAQTLCCHSGLFSVQMSWWQITSQRQMQSRIFGGNSRFDRQFETS